MKNRVNNLFFFAVTLMFSSSAFANEVSYNVDCPAPSSSEPALHLDMRSAGYIGFTYNGFENDTLYKNYQTQPKASETQIVYTPESGDDPTLIEVLIPASIFNYDDIDANSYNGYFFVKNLSKPVDIQVVWSDKIENYTGCKISP